MADQNGVADHGRHQLVPVAPMIAALLWLLILAVLIAFAAELRAKIVADERGDTLTRAEWSLPDTCFLCSGRIGSEGHYVAWSGGRSQCVCKACATLECAA